MKKQPSVLVDDVQACRAVFQDFAKLPLLLDEFRFSLPERGHIIDPRYPLPSHETNVASLISDLRIGDQDVDQLAVLRFPHRLLVQDFATTAPQLLDDARSLVQIVPTQPGVNRVNSSSS